MGLNNMRRLAFILWLLFAANFYYGCAMFKAKAPESPSLTVTSTPAGTVTTSSGDARVPAQVTTGSMNTSLPLPLGSEVHFNATLGTYDVKFNQAPSTLTTTSTTQHVETPTAFTPPAPPSLSEVATADSKKKYYVFGFIGIAAAIFGLIEHWSMVMWGGVACAAASVCGLFVIDHPYLTYLIIGGAALIVAGPTLWHTVVKYLPNHPDVANKATQT